MSASRCELDGVVEQVDGDLEEQVAIALQRQAGGDIRLQGLAAVLGGGTKQFDGVLQKGREVDPLGRPLWAVLQPRNAQQSLEHRLHALGLSERRGDARLRRFPVVASVGKVLELGAEPRQRRPQLVGDVVGDAVLAALPACIGRRVATVP